MEHPSKEDASMDAEVTVRHVDGLHRLDYDLHEILEAHTPGQTQQNLPGQQALPEECAAN